MVFDGEPGLDEVVVVFAGWVAGLAGVVDGERGFGVGQVDDLTVGWHCDDDIGAAGQRGTHVDGVDVTANLKWATIKEHIEGFDRA